MPTFLLVTQAMCNFATQVPETSQSSLCSVLLVAFSSGSSSVCWSQSCSGGVTACWHEALDSLELLHSSEWRFQ